MFSLNNTSDTKILHSKESVYNIFNLWRILPRRIYPRHIKRVWDKYVWDKFFQNIIITRNSIRIWVETCFFNLCFHLNRLTKKFCITLQFLTNISDNLKSKLGDMIDRNHLRYIDCSCITSREAI